MAESAAELIARLNAFDWKRWRESFGADFRPLYEEGLSNSARAAAEDAGLEWTVDDPFSSAFMTEYVGERIVQLEGTTKDDVIRIIRNAFDGRGDKSIATLTEEILDAVREKFDSYQEYRAARIARTETAIMQNHGVGLLAKAEGYDVDIFDGEDFDDACREANGQTWSAEDFLANPVEHSNCTRSGVLHVDIAEEDIAAFQWALFAAVQQAALRLV